MLLLLILLVVILMIFILWSSKESYDPNPCYSKNVIMSTCYSPYTKLYQEQDPNDYARPGDPEFQGAFSSWHCSCQ